MDFFEHQEQARRKTGLLVIYFAMAVLCIFGALFLLASFIFSRDPESGMIFWNMALAGWVGLGTLLVVGLGSLYKVSALAGGGRTVAESLGGKLLSQDSANFKEKRLLNVIEEMALASGTPVPPTYLMEEPSINAFAAGYSPGKAVIGVTRGCIEKLNREELQGVMAHEFSHILNGDMRMNIRLIGILHGILLLSAIGYYMMRVGGYSGRSRSRGNGGALLIGGVGMLAIGYIGAFFANLIKAAVSRQREYLADASAVQFTRNPRGIAGALRQIGGFPAGSKLKAPNAAECSHMFFSPGIASLFATHPPLAKRISRIDPEWKGTEQTPSQIPQEVETSAPATVSSFSTGKTIPVRTDGEAVPPPDPRNVIEAAGKATQTRIKHAREIVDGLPQVLLDQIHEPFSARAVIYALLLDESNDKVREKQILQLSNQSEPGTSKATLDASGFLHHLSAEQKFSLVELAGPAIAHLSPVQFSSFCRTINQLAVADEQINLFEWALQKLIKHELGESEERRNPHGTATIGTIAQDCGVILGALAHYGQGDAPPEPAYNQGFAFLGVDASTPLPPPEACGITEVDQAVNKLNRLSPKAQKTFLQACATTIGHDGLTTDVEFQILRSVAAVLGCPLPPLL